MNGTLLWWVTLAALCQAMLVSAALPDGCTADGTVLVSCAGVGAGTAILSLADQGLTAIQVGAFDNMTSTIGAVYVAGAG